MAEVKASGFSLAKHRDLKGDDFFIIKRASDITIAVLCDGVGSAERGREAASRVATFMVNSLKTKPLSWSIQKSIIHFLENINAILYNESMENFQREELLTTIALVLIQDDRVYGANIGDSRIYLLRDKTLTLLSKDHIEANSQGVLSEAVGLREEVSINYFENLLKKGDKIILCSDGLYTVLKEQEIIKTSSLGANFLVKSASTKTNDNLPDDTTAIVLDVVDLSHISKLKRLDLKIEDSVRVDSIIDGYKLLKPLSNNKRTWLCEKQGLNYVIKFAPLEAKDDKKILDLFIKEVWNAKRLKAGFFPKAVIPKNRSSRYYIMQHIKGVELNDAIKTRVLSVDDGVALTKFLLNCSLFLLKYDLVHGDIKPENIIKSDRNGKTLFKMVDFGSIVEIFSINSKAGTPSYLAPERFKGEAISESSEIFAIGVVLYKSLTGKFPYGEIEPFQNPTFKKAKRVTTLNPKVPKWLESVILRAIEPDSERRYKNYSEMLYELENPSKVKPYFDKSISIIHREPVKVYKIAFIISFAINFLLIILLIK